MNPPLPPKKDVVLHLLERSNVDVYLDPRRAGVLVPPQFHKEPRLILKIGLNMPVPIPDLHVDDEGMTCTLSFSRVRFYCVLPWTSVFAMVGDDGRGMVWPDDVPSELSVRTQGGGEHAPGESSASSSKPRPRLRDASAPREPVEGEGSKGRPRRTKKSKKEDAAPAQPSLVAVPPASASGPQMTAPAPSEIVAPDVVAPPTPRVNGDSKSPSPTGGASGPKPKRELPPYLRVVK